MGTFKTVDQWLRRLLAPPDSMSAQTTVVLQRPQKSLHVALAFLLVFVTSVFLLRAGEGWMIPFSILLFFAGAFSASKPRRRYLLIGVALGIPFGFVAWFASLGPFH
ncbi:MAG: hypothetical protein HYX28_06680 [Candidatus Koribacter versatilis]|uniref:Uncharacterized protein n=1 Tax=Candidatus Korobacter versatilis TaxID=658062 RepID=A0A932EPR7_9BACT|nr:hypothetical protein [Candidatus Koribacter versatilis]